jgi:pimeloyl-ACP methyl ester carboxylesterase
MPVSLRHIHAQSSDGLTLYAADHGPLDSRLAPIICLPGLTRNSRDFEPLITALENSRRILALDLRGRGRSQYATDSKTYTPATEAQDTLAVLAAAKISRAIFIGTSRGGLVSLILHALQPQLIKGLLLNDIGPALDPQGLKRIRSYLGIAMALPDWKAAANLLKTTHPGFTGISEDEWVAFARRVFRDQNGIPAADYDPAIAATFPALEDIEAGKVPQLWELYQALGPDMPLAVLRGETSDLLSAATVQRMQQITPQLNAVTVKGRGHVPFLNEPESLEAIHILLAQADLIA